MSLPITFIFKSRKSLKVMLNIYREHVIKFWVIDGEYIVKIMRGIVNMSMRYRCTLTKILCPGHNFLMLFYVWMIFHTIVINDPRVCHDLDPWSYLQGQIEHFAFILIWAITSYCPVGFGYYFRQLSIVVSKAKVTIDTLQDFLWGP